MSKIVLIGYMGSGKSTIARLLSEKLQLNSFDLDYVIEEKEGLTISNIFKDKGEVYFRKSETQHLTSFLQQQKSYILSLGGGTPCYGNNMELLKQNGIITIYLKASINELYNRLETEKSKRPLLANKTNEEMKDFIAKHLFERNVFYNQSKLIVSVDGKAPEHIVNEIFKLLV